MICEYCNQTPHGGRLCLECDCLACYQTTVALLSNVRGEKLVVTLTRLQVVGLLTALTSYAEELNCAIDDPEDGHDFQVALRELDLVAELRELLNE